MRHSGIEDEYYPYVEDVVISFVKENKTITFKQPIAEEEFKYTVYIDHKGTFKNKNYNLCSFAENRFIRFTRLYRFRRHGFG